MIGISLFTVVTFLCLYFSLERAVSDMIAPHIYSGLEVAGWDCPDHPPPAYAMLQGPKVGHRTRPCVTVYRDFSLL